MSQPCAAEHPNVNNTQCDIGPPQQTLLLSTCFQRLVSHHHPYIPPSTATHPPLNFSTINYSTRILTCLRVCVCVLSCLSIPLYQVQSASSLRQKKKIFWKYFIVFYFIYSNVSECIYGHWYVYKRQLMCGEVNDPRGMIEPEDERETIHFTEREGRTSTFNSLAGSSSAGRERNPSTS